MASRFHGRESRADRPNDRDADDGFGEWWAAIAVIAVAALAIGSLSGSAGPIADRIDPTPVLLASILPAERSLAAVDGSLSSLCEDPVLLALELPPDCETGVITLPDDLFDGFGSAALTSEAKQDVSAAVRVYLNRLRELPALWNSLEAIEIRGHSDPRAVRAPYTTNMVGSQQRPLGVLLFLAGPEGLTAEDLPDFERLAVVSAVSFSRPPASCPEASRDCYPEWRRVEIRPVFSESLRRREWLSTLEEIRSSARRIEEGLSQQEGGLPQEEVQFHGP
jgi:outer membrane protein OmpA-like peptidoglycan-associated protein